MVVIESDVTLRLCVCVEGWKLPVVATVVVVLGVIVVAVVAVFIHKYKKHRSQYGQHELLLNNGDDDPAIANDDAMITA